MLTQNDPLVGASVSARQTTPALSVQPPTPILSERTPVQRHSDYSIADDLPMNEIRRQNDVERWRNKLRLQEKFQVKFSSIITYFNHNFFFLFLLFSIHQFQVSFVSRKIISCQSSTDKVA